ncbi:MAG: DUF4114 domain-containing protein [Bacteroidales bacterium]|jgi:hypothetical protein|nr:DUF4114 domain-containing protein [Bacteroidales bacterium]
MKRFSWILIILLGTWISGCNKDNDDSGKKDDATFILKNGSIIVNNDPDMKFVSANEFPEGMSTESDFSSDRKRSSLKSDPESETDGLRGFDYRLKLVGKAATLVVNGKTTQATHVKITDDAQYAFVSYNTAKGLYGGGVVVYKITLSMAQSLDDIKADVSAVSIVEMPNADISAVDYFQGKLFITGSTIDPEFGYKGDDNPAFYAVMELDAAYKFKNQDPLTITQLTSFDGTSIRVSNDRVYITTGDGTEGTNGGLYIFSATDNSLIKFIENKDHARSVDATGTHVFLMQAEPARVTMYDPDGNNETQIYRMDTEAQQKYAKSEILAWNGYLFAAENESGVRMLDENGAVIDRLSCPGQEDLEKHVTNSVAMNSDKKKNLQGSEVSSDMLLVANGEKGICWYDIMKVEGKDRIVLCNNNNVLAEEGISANFIASKGNIVFVANGEGGLKVLYIGFNEGTPPPPPFDACTDVKQYFNNVQSFFPEGKSVFSSNIDAVNKLFSNPDDIPNEVEVLEDTKLFISFIWSGAGYKNALGFFVVPSVDGNGTLNPMSNKDYYDNYINKEGELYTTSVTVKVFNRDKYGLFDNITSGVVPQGTWQIQNYNTSDGKFKKGDRVVFFLVQNGWVSQNNRVEISSSAWAQPIFMDHDINKSNPGLWNYAQIGNAAPDNFKAIQHNTFYSEACKSVVLFFEDKYTGTDLDYNDIIFSISDDIIENSEQGDVLKIKKPKYTVDENGDIGLTQ